MTRLRTLLVATDFSVQAGQAALRAGLLAKAGGASLELLHVIETRGFQSLRELFGEEAGEPVPERLERAFRSDLEELARIVGEPVGLSPGLHLRQGNVVNEICSIADALDASLLVLGAHGSGFIRQILLGTTAERLLRRAVRPMLVVRNEAARPYRQVLVGVDFSAGTASAIRHARALAPDAQLTLFHAFELPFESKLRLAGIDESVLEQRRALARQQAAQGLNRLAAENGLDEHAHFNLVAHGGPATRLLEAAQQGAADLLVVCKHGQNMSTELLLGSVTRQVLTEASCDVLVVR